MERLEREIIGIQKKKADLMRKIGLKTTELHRAQQKAVKEQDKERQDLVRRLEQQESILRQRNLAHVSAELAKTESPSRIHDAFVSHASEDKEAVVAPLAAALRKRDFDLWYDDFELEVGDSLRRKVDTGLAQARFGIVVLSPSFFEKNWPQYELDGLVAKEIAGGKVILPVWHRISKNDVMRYSPTLADRVGLSTANYSIEELAVQLARALRRAKE